MKTTLSIYENNIFKLIYNEHENHFHLINETEVIVLRLCELIALKKRIQAVDIVAMFDSDSPDLEIIALPGCGQFLLLNLQEILQIRDLLSGAFTMLELNHVLHESLYLR